MATYTPSKPYSSNMIWHISSRFRFGFIGGSVKRILRPLGSMRSFSSNV